MIETFIYINADCPWFFATFSFIFGAITGSFLNVCIYRIPAERSVVFPGSTCACGKAIAWYNNIPILTWLFLRGRASCCGERFSVRYPAIESLTGVLFYAVMGDAPSAARDHRLPVYCVFDLFDFYRSGSYDYSGSFLYRRDGDWCAAVDFISRRCKAWRAH